MASNPLVAQGNLNKLLASAFFPTNPQLNVSASFLGDDGVSIRFEGMASAYLTTMTGAVPSPNPYQIATCELHMLRTQGLAAVWKAQMETTTTIGDCVITPDAITLPQYTLNNCTIRGITDLPFAGKDPGFMVTIQGTYYENSSLFQT